MKKLMIITMLAVLVAGCNGPTPAEKKIHQENKETPVEKALNKRMGSLKIAGKSEEEQTPQEKVDALCKDNVPTYKQSPACTKAIEEAKASAMQKLEERDSVPLTVESLNRLNDSGKMTDHDNVALLSCQLSKYADDHGQKAATKHGEEIPERLMLAEYQHPQDKFDKQMKKQLEKTGVEPIYTDKDHDTVQAQLIMEGYTCSLNEVAKYS